jgi:hypothetical protein
MKQLLTVFPRIAIGMSVIALVGCADVDTSKGDFSKDVSVQSGTSVLPLAPSDSIISDVERWIREPEPKWKRTYTTYAPGLVMRNSTFSLNLLDGVAVLNFKPDPSKEEWVQVQRESTAKDIPAFDGLRAKVEEAEQAAPHNH